MKYFREFDKKFDAVIFFTKIVIYIWARYLYNNHV